MSKIGEGIGASEEAMLNAKDLRLTTGQACVVSRDFIIACNYGRRNNIGSNRLSVVVPFQTPVRLQGGEEIIPEMHGDIETITLGLYKIPTVILIGDRYAINRGIPYHDPISLTGREDLQIRSLQPIKTVMVVPGKKLEEVMKNVREHTSPKT